MRILTWDTEIEHPIPERDGKADWNAALKGECGCACTVIWDSQTRRPHLYGPTSRDHERAVLHLNSGDLLVGFNTIQFDTPVLQSLSGTRIIVPQYDILQAVWTGLGGRRQKGYRLRDLTQRTLGLDKTGQGESAPKLAGEGRWAELFDYCLNDVFITRELFNHVVRLGYVIDVDGQKLLLRGAGEDYA